MARLLVISHPEVLVDPNVSITEWRLSDKGQERAEKFALSPAFSGVTKFWSSYERKARDTAEILAKPHRIVVQLTEDLGENDRSATGFLPPQQFEAAADAFFAAPTESFRGWETAKAAQARIVRALQSCLDAHGKGDFALVTHGAVGTLLWCHLANKPIDRRFDQPGQGHFWQADLASLQPETGWRPIA